MIDSIFILTMSGDDYHGDIVVGAFLTKEAATREAAKQDREQVPCKFCGDGRTPIVSEVKIVG